MNKFLKKPGSSGPEKINADITVNVNISKDKAQQFKDSIQSIVNNASEDDIILLGKLCNNAIMRPMAIAKLREYIK